MSALRDADDSFIYELLSKSDKWFAESFRNLDYELCHSIDCKGNFQPNAVDKTKKQNCEPNKTITLYRVEEVGTIHNTPSEEEKKHEKKGTIEPIDVMTLWNKPFGWLHLPNEKIPLFK